MSILQNVKKTIGYDMYTILHLETSNFYKTLIKNITIELGVNYISVNNADEAIQVLDNQKIDLILTAMELETGSSIQFITDVNESEYKNIPIVVITGNDTYEDRKSMYDLGIVDYISKKSTPEEIKMHIQTYKTDDEIAKKLRNLQIAVCDDSSMDRYIIERIFNMNNVNEVDFFESGEELLQAEKNYDVYIIDLVLKKMSGRSIILKLRERGSESVIITISGIDHFKTVSNVLSVGADDYITKPFNNDLFMARLKTNVRSYLLLKEIEDKNKLLQQMAITDGLTNLFNHKFVIDSLSNEIKKAERYGSPLSIFMMDIDFFKKLNDSYGHQFGDQILVKVAKIIHDSVRDIDIVGRYGGEEFLVVLPETDRKNAFIVAERIRQSVEKIKANKEDFSVTISGGVQEYSSQSTENLIKEADFLLYKAKQSGRNRIEVGKN